MKLSVEELTRSIDVQRYAVFGLWAFVLMGIVIKALIQSSSAVIVIVLSAPNAGVLDIYQAFGIVIGANIGTIVHSPLCIDKGLRR